MSSRSAETKVMGDDASFADIEAGVGRAEPLSLAMPERAALHVEQVLRHLPGRRLVVSGRLGDQDVVAKIFSSAPGAKTECEREAARLSLLADSGVNVPPLLLAVSRDGWCGVVTEKLAGDAASDMLARGTMNPHDMQAGLADLVVDLFHKGFVQADLHLDNFLYSGGAWFVLDAGSIKPVGFSVVRKRQLRNAVAGIFVLFCVQKTDQHLLAEMEKYKAWGNGIRAYIARLRRKRLARLVRKSLRGSTRYARVSRGPLVGFSQRRYGEPLNALLEQGLDESMERSEMIKNGNSATVVRYRGDGIDWVIKRYNLKKPGALLKRQYSSRALRSWKNAIWLGFNCIPTPEPVACIREKRKGLYRTEYYITEHVSGRSLKNYSHDDLLENSHVLGQLSDIFTVMEDPGFAHGDFKAANFIVDDSGRLNLLDLDAMTFAASSGRLRRAVRQDRNRLLRNWPADSRPAIDQAIG